MLLVPLHFTLFIRFCLLYLDHVISTPLMRKKSPVRVRLLPTMRECHEAMERCTSGDTATDRNPRSEITHLVCGTLGNRCLSGGGSAKLGNMQALLGIALALSPCCKNRKYYRDVLEVLHILRGGCPLGWVAARFRNKQSHTGSLGVS